MRTLLLVMGLYFVHRVLLSFSPAYAARMRRLDRQLSWVSILVVVYLLVNVVWRLLLSSR